MKPFQFSLEPLRTMRQHKEQTARERYAATLRACEQAAARMQAASIELTGCWKSLGEKLSAGTTGEDLLRTRAWCNVLELRVKARGAELEQARLTVDAVWKELMQATREREAIDKLREKRHQAYNQEVQRAEQKALDETALQLSQTPGALHPSTSILSD